MREESFGGLTVRITGGTDGQGGGDGPVVVLMHGFGAPATDLVPLARVIDAPAGTRFVFPAAPLELGAEYAGARAWWPVDMIRIQLQMARGELSARLREVPPGMAEARALVDAMLTALTTALRPSALVLGGFSQGAMLACDAAFHSTRPLASLVLLSGTLLAQDEWGLRMASRAGLRVFQSHGDADPVLPVQNALALRDCLTAAGLDVRWVPFRGGHEIPPGVVDALGKHLRGVLA